MATITIPSDIDELQAVAEMSAPDEAITDILRIHRPVTIRGGGDDLYCVECSTIADEPGDHPYPCSTADAVLSRVSDEIKERLTWLHVDASDQSEDPIEDDDDDDEPVTPRKTGRRRRARKDDPDEDEF